MPRAPSTQQQQVIDLARAPRTGGQPGRVVVTIAGPGSGKTTTQEDLIVRLLELGHTNVLKIFFNKTAADDAQEKLRQRLGADAAKVTCITSHKAAKDYVRVEMTPGGPPVYQRCMGDENELQREIGKLFSSEVEEWIGWVGPNTPSTPDEQKHLHPAS